MCELQNIDTDIAPTSRHSAPGLTALEKRATGHRSSVRAGDDNADQCDKLTPLIFHGMRVPLP